MLKNGGILKLEFLSKKTVIFTFSSDKGKDILTKVVTTDYRY